MAATDGPRVITLLTDFGTRDHYVAAMKGVIATLAPEARTIDLTHDVAPFQIAQGSYLLAQAWRWFPVGTVHLAVVDPGVGSVRRPLAAMAEGFYFVLPDNGLLSMVANRNAIEVREIRNPDLMLGDVSRTFHGRDIFAPTAARLATGFRFEEAGPIVDDWIQLVPRGSAVIHIDHFGNVITSLRASDPALEGRARWELEIAGHTVTRFAPNYGASPDAELFLIEGSGGYLEISINQASAVERLGCRVGDRVTLLPARPLTDRKATDGKS